MIGLSAPLAAPVSQLAEPTSDGYPDENAQKNCAGACLAWAIHQLCGVAGVNGDELKDRAYGQGYVGLTAIPQYAAAVAPFGLRIASFDNLASGDILLGVKNALANNRQPCIVAIPSDWGDEPPTSPFCHFVCIVQGTGGNLTAMNPWGGFWQTQPEAWWQERFRLGGYWQLIGTEQATVWTIERDGSGNITGAHDDKGARVGSGFAWTLFQHPDWLSSDAIIGESYYASGQCVAALENGAWMDWASSAPTVIGAHTDGGAVVAQLYNLTAAAAAKIASLNTQIAELEKQVATDPAAEAAIVALAAALAGLPAKG